MTYPSPDESNNEAWERLHPGVPRPTSPRPPGNADSNRIVVEALAAAERFRQDVAKDPDSWGKDDPNPSMSDMSLRQYYAGQALVGFQQFVRGGWSGIMEQQMADSIADNCYAIADSMIRRAT